MQSRNLGRYLQFFVISFTILRNLSGFPGFGFRFFYSFVNLLIYNCKIFIMFFS